MDLQTGRNQQPANLSERVALRRRRYEAEARLLAYRVGWLESDDIGMRKLKRELQELLRVEDDTLVRTLLDG